MCENRNRKKVMKKSRDKNMGLKMKKLLVPEQLKRFSFIMIVYTPMTKKQINGLISKAGKKKKHTHTPREKKLGTETI